MASLGELEHDNQKKKEKKLPFTSKKTSSRISHSKEIFVSLIVFHHMKNEHQNVLILAQIMHVCSARLTDPDYHLLHTCTHNSIIIPLMYPHKLKM